MYAPDLAVSPNANRRVPGVKVPVAAPSCALDFTSAPSCWSVRPCVEGNSLTRGCSAAGSSATAGGRTGAEVVVVVLACVVGLDALELADWLAALEVALVDEEPHAASTSAAAAASPAAATRARINGPNGPACTGQSVQSLTPGGAACPQRPVEGDSAFLAAVCT